MSKNHKKKVVSSLKLHIDFLQYATGEIKDSESAIAQPWRRLFQDGIDPGKIYYLLVSELSNPVRRVLGCVCETPGRRLLFFPGCQARQLNSRFSREKPGSSVSLTGIVDHITFELARRIRHITEVLQSGERRVALNLPSSREVAPEMHAWFGITLRSLSRLDCVPGKLWFFAESATSDANRRLALFRNMGKAARVTELEMPRIPERSFMQMNFFVDLDPLQRRNRITTFLPKGPPELRSSVEIPATMPKQQIRTLQIGTSLAIRIHPIVWEGEPEVDFGFGF